MYDKQLYFGDNLTILREYVKDESVDLIYLDPPFNSNVDYKLDNDIVFSDKWTWNDTSELYYEQLTSGISKIIKGLYDICSNDLMAYLVMMSVRLIELYRVLKPTGSLYLHCDPTASHYLKIILDSIFNAKNFRNEIIWYYQNGGATKRWFSKKHDVILFYNKSNDYNFYPENIKITRTEKSLKRAKNPKGARISINNTTKLPMDVWTDIQVLNPMSNERLGYPTQKPIALLERIILTSSKLGDVILDPFCGCGTSIIVSEKLDRRWIGIDNNPLAIKLTRDRLSGIIQ